MSRPAPTLDEERALLAAGAARVAGVDEVGRGAPAGPVTVGVAVVDATVEAPPAGVRDSKDLSPGARTSLVPAIEAWAVAAAVGHASPSEIDAFGMTNALRLAGHRALARIAGPTPDVVLLDGHHDWLTVPEQGDLLVLGHPDLVPTGRVVTRVKADQRCAAVAAASVLAKVSRDAIMVGLAAQHPGYGWERNKGYASPEHQDALRRLGPTPLHRLSWNLPTPSDPSAAPRPEP